MRKLVHLLWLLAAPFLMASCSDEEDPAPAPYSALTSTVVFSKYTNNGYLPKDRPATDMRVYSGDTIRYNFRFETNQGIKDFKVYDNLRGREWPLMVGSGQLTQQNGVWMNEYTLEYLVNSYILQAKPGEDIVLTVEAQEEDGTIYKDPITGKAPEIRLTIAEPLVYKGMKLYNYWGNSANSLSIVDFRIGEFPRQALVDENGRSPFALVQNIYSPRSWSDNQFYHAFTSGERNDGRQATFVKVPAGGKNWTQPNQVALAMRQYGPDESTVENVQVGDVYVFKARYPFDTSWVVYGIIEVKEIVDDGGDTMSNTGHDEDYMVLDIKYFPGYRY
ncbi:hypothetical protein [Sabulibacter ruber]|uniref:hypothetical protein n=1 Tax=Sabulibacter ruber TaxID=2811901 RepID=UPI001A96400F|nr:hypothetical protein [Sabulibacter ruber]